MQGLTPTRIIIAWPELQTHARKPYLFRSYRHPRTGNPDERNPDGRTGYPIWEVARATSAAPPYFAPMVLEENDPTFHFLDGGLGANNPCEEARNSIKQLNNDKNDAVQIILSIGTGTKSAPTEIPKNFYKKIRTLLLHTLAAMATDTYATHSRVEKEMKDRGHYYRLQPGPGIGDIETDACEGLGGAKTLKLLREETAKYLEIRVVKEEITNVARRLVMIRRARSRGPDLDRWEEFCYGVEYACSLGGCHNAEERFKRKEFRQHVEESHPSLFDPASIESLLDDGKRFPL